MSTAIVLLFVVVVYVLVATTLIRLSTRMVAGFFPTFGSAFGALLVTILGVAVVWFIAVVADFRSQVYRIPLVLAALAVQCKVYASLLRDKETREIGFTQAFFVILCQLALGYVVRSLVVFLMAGGTLELDALMPDRLLPRERSTPAPRRAGASARWGTLATPVNVPTPYGNVTYRAGLPVQIMRETSAGYVIRLGGKDFSATREQVVINR